MNAALASSHAAPMSPIVWPELPRFDRGVALAVLVSALIHGIALGWLPGFGKTVQAPPPLTVQLTVPVGIAPPPMVTAVAPAPTFAPPPRVQEAVRRPPSRMPPPLLTRATAEPAREPEPASFSVAEQAAIQPAPAVPEPEAPVPQASVPAEPAPTPDPRAIAAYGRDLAGRVATRQAYPRIARLRQWQGTTTLQLQLDRNGRLLDVRVLNSSGHEILDRQALAMVREAGPLPPLPSTLAGQPLSVDVPVVFRLAS